MQIEIPSTTQNVTGFARSPKWHKKKLVYHSTNTLFLQSCSSFCATSSVTLFSASDALHVLSSACSLTICWVLSWHFLRHRSSSVLRLLRASSADIMPLSADDLLNTSPFNNWKYYVFTTTDNNWYAHPSQSMYKKLSNACFNFYFYKRRWFSSWNHFSTKCWKIAIWYPTIESEFG